MKNRFEKYLVYVKKNGKAVSVNREAFELVNEAFELFKSMYNTEYGSIEEDQNLIGGIQLNEVINFAVYLTGHDKATIDQMYRDWNNRKR